MMYTYFGAAALCLSVSLYFHFKLKSQKALLKTEECSQVEGLSASGSSARHGMVVQENDELIPDSKLTGSYYSRLYATISK